MKNHHDCPMLHTRREFLRSTLLGGALTWTVPTFLANTFQALHAQAVNSTTQIVTGKDSPILVILQLAGGNDGLNTLVPYADDNYYRARPKLAVAADSVLKLNELVGLNPQLTGLQELFQNGNLAIVQGVGYPNPNRSHFRATEIWETASDAERRISYGWLGRYFDNACAGADPTVGINIGSETPQAFNSPKPTGVSLKNPDSYRFVSGDKPAMGQPDSTDYFYREINKMSDDAHSGAGENSGGSIGMITAATQTQESPLEFIERTALDAQVSSDRIIKISRTFQNQATYPTSGLANDLRLIARLIGGGLSTRIYYASQGGYDTHTNQRGSQDRQLKDLGDALAAFCRDLKAQGNFGRVTIMTFSEFGRRVAENGSGGTDHGTASPQFILGGAVKGGLFGEMPSLKPDDLDHGDLKFNVDFRSIYAGLLENWMHTPSAPILGQQFRPLNLVV